MADIIDRGVIEIVGDARKLRAAIAEAKNSLRTLGEGQKDISRQASASIDRYVGSLIAQNQTIGKSNREIELHKLALRGASNEQLNAANTALKAGEAFAKNQQTIAALKTGFIALGAAAVAAVAAAAAAFDQLVKQAANFKDLSEKTGETAENLASFAVAAQASGKSMDDVSKFLVGLNKNLVGVDDDAEKAGAAIQALGLDLATFKQLSPADQLETLANTLKQFEEGAGKANVMEALAKGGADLLPVLNKVSGEIGRQNILTQEQIELADEYATRQAVVRAQLSLHAQAIVTQMLPAYVDLQAAFLDVLKGMAGVQDGAGKLANDKSIQDFADNAARAFAFVLDALDGIVRGFQIAGKSIGGFGAVMERITRLDFRGALEAASAFREDIGAVLNRTTAQGALESRIAARGRERATANQTPPQDRRVLNFQGARKKATGGAEDDSARQLARAQLQFDLEQIKEAGAEQVEAFRRAESIMQAMRSAALVDDRSYFASKLAFIQSFAREEEAALQAQIERRQREVFTGKNADKDRLDNEREIIKLQAQINKIRADAVAKTQINSIEEAAAVQKIRQAYLDAKDAAEAYLQTIARRNAREIEGIGRGQRFREVNAGRGEIDDRAQAERRRLEGELRRQQITREQFDQYLAVVEDTYRREVDMYEHRTEILDRMQGDWINGAREALQNYIDETRNVAKQFEDVFTRGFQSAEDAILDLTSGGVKSFKDFGDAVHKFIGGIATDLARIEIRRNITGPLAEWLKENGRIEGIGGVLGFPRPGPAGGGGLVDTGEPFEGVPAWLNVLLGRTGSRSGGVAVPVVEGTIAKAGIPGVGQAANAAQFTTQISASATTFSTTVTTAATTAATTLTGEVSAAGATFNAETAAAGATFTAEATAAGATLTAEIAAAGASFVAEVTAAGAAFAASVTASSAASGVSGGVGIIGSLFDGFAEGGAVKGPGSATSDSIPAMLSAGEFVVKADAVRQPGVQALLETLNERGKVSRFSTGGLVTNIFRQQAVMPVPDNSSRGSAGSSDNVTINVAFPPGTDRKTVDYAVDQMERRVALRNRHMTTPARR